MKTLHSIIIGVLLFGFIPSSHALNGGGGGGGGGGSLPETPLSVAHGGTAVTTFGTDAGVLISNGATGFNTTTAGTTGQYLISNGAGVDPTFQTKPDYSVSLKNSGNQSIAHNTLTMITYDTELFDSDSMHEGVTNPSRITFNHTGKYVVACRIGYASNVTGIRKTQLKLNGATYIGAQNDLANTIEDTNMGLMIGAYSFAVNDYIECEGYQSSGISINSIGSSYNLFSAACVNC